MSITFQRLIAATDQPAPAWINDGWTDNLIVDLKLTALLKKLAQSIPMLKLNHVRNADRNLIKFDSARTLASLEKERKRLVDLIKKVSDKHKLRQARLDLEKNKLQTAERRRYQDGVNKLRYSIIPKSKILVTPTDIHDGQSGEFIGTRFDISSVSDDDIKNIDDVTSAIIEVIDDRIQKYYYRAMEDAKPLQRNYTRPDGTQLSGPILQRLSRLGSFDCMAFVKENALEDLRTWRLLAADAVGKVDYKSWQFVGMKLGEPWIWVPAKAVILLYDIAQRALYFQPPGYTQQAKVPVGKIAALAPSGKADSPDIEMLHVRLSAGGGGGGGAMRADRVTEVDCAWDGDAALGVAIGLQASDRRPKDDRIQSPLGLVPASAKTQVPSADAPGIQYWRTYLKPANSPKKNLPRDTMPLYQEAAIDVGQDERLGFLAAACRKKRKGEWSLAGGIVVTAGEPLTNGNKGDRLDAASVMKAAFQEVGLSSTDGAATPFADWTVKQVPQGASAWTTVSKSVTRWDGADPSEDRKNIRTDQEWCHLIGHGDGGNEILENFVAGSKHCNTEQLAIETAQRAAGKLLLKPLRAKVTAYLFPSMAQPKTMLRDADVSFFAMLNPQTFPPANEAACIAAARTIVAPGAPAPNWATLLRGAGEPPHDCWVPDAGNPPTAPTEKMQHAIRSALFQAAMLPLPIASVIRYKIFAPTSQTAAASYVKVFDHMFWAQKEGFDLNEFNILHWLVRRILAEATGTLDQYNKTIAARAAANLAQSAE